MYTISWVPQEKMTAVTCYVQDFLGVIGEDDGRFNALIQHFQDGSVPVIVHYLFSLLSDVFAFHCNLYFHSKRVR